MPTVLHGYTNDGSGYDLKLLAVLLRPSWVSGLVATSISLVVVLLIIANNHFVGASLQQLWQTEAPQSPISNSYQSIANTLATNRVLSSLPLLIFWACVGLIVYSVVINVATAFQDVAELKAELGFAHVNRRHLLQETGLRLAVRLGVLLLWVLFARFFIHRLLPYMVAVVHFASGAVGWLNTVEYALVGFVILTVCIHIHTVFLRLLLLRPRLFGWVEEA